MRAWSLAGCCIVLFASVLTAWVPARWPVSIPEVGSFALALAWVIRLAVSGERPRFAPVLGAVAVLVAWGMVQLACGWTVASSETVRWTLAWTANLALMFACLETLAEFRMRQRFLDLLLWFTAAVSAVGIAQSLSAGGRIFWLFPERDPTGTIGPVPYHANFAVFIEAILPLALIAALEDSRKRLWTSFMAALMIAAVVVSASRGGFVILMAEIVTVIALCEWKKLRVWRRAVPTIALTVVTIVVMTVMAGWGNLVTRLQLRDPFAGRREMLLSTIQMTRDHLWTGVGFGNWPIAYPGYSLYDDGLFANAAHSDWGQFAAEGGVIGLAAFGALFVLALRGATKNIWGVGLVFVFVHALFDYPFQKPQIAAVLMAMLAAAENSTSVRQES